jgi:hypothetical protein
MRNQIRFWKWTIASGQLDLKNQKMNDVHLYQNQWV